MIYYIDTPYDNDVKILPSYNLSIIDAWIFSPSNNVLEKMLKAINGAGLETHVRGSIYISNKYRDQHGFVYSANIAPSNPSLFFNNYTNLLLKIIPTLNKYHVKLFTPFVETTSIEKYCHLIKGMYTKLSEIFAGELGFDEEANNMMKGQSPGQNGRTFEEMARNFTFWNWTDSYGRPMRIEYSGWVSSPVETQTDQRVSVIEKMFEQFWSIPTSYYAAEYPNNPQMLGEIGAWDIDGYVLGPDYFYSIPSNKWSSDEQERADFMHAVLNTSKELGINNCNIWQFILADEDPNWEFGFGINIGFKQPASLEYRVIRSIISNN